MDYIINVAHQILHKYATELYLGITSILFLLELKILHRLNILEKRISSRLKQLEQETAGNEFDIYLLSKEFREIVNGTLELIKEKLKLLANNDPALLTAEKYKEFEELFVTSVLSRIKGSRIYKRLINDVFGSEENLKSWLRSIYELETINFYMSRSPIE
jgi:hypothetical protein